MDSNTFNFKDIKTEDLPIDIIMKRAVEENMLPTLNKQLKKIENHFHTYKIKSKYYNQKNKLSQQPSEIFSRIQSKSDLSPP